MRNTDWIDSQSLSLQEWLELVYKPPKYTLFLMGAFPSDRHRDEYVSTVNSRSHEEVLRLLHAFLVKSTSYETWDNLNFNTLVDAFKNDRERYERMISLSYFRRLINYFKVSKSIYPWEGITWILDLLPHSPKIALEALNAYLLVHIPILPDTLLQGLFDAAEVIRAKYIGLPGSQNEKVALLLDLSPRQFEHLTERLYESMGYKALLTPPSRDGGRDVVAKINEGARHEFLLIECKRYSDTVDISTVRELFGVISSEKANRGVIITSGRFTSEAQNFAEENSIQLISADEFVMLLNEHLGANWVQKLDRLIAESEKQYLELKKQRR